MGNRCINMHIVTSICTPLYSHTLYLWHVRAPINMANVVLSQTNKKPNQQLQEAGLTDMKYKKKLHSLIYMYVYIHTYMYIHKTRPSNIPDSY